MQTNVTRFVVLGTTDPEPSGDDKTSIAFMVKQDVPGALFTVMKPFAERGKPEDPIKEAMERRADLDDRYLKNVAALLPADKAAELPKPRTRKGPLVIRGGTGG